MVIKFTTFGTTLGEKLVYFLIHHLIALVMATTNCRREVSVSNLEQIFYSATLSSAQSGFMITQLAL